MQQEILIPRRAVVFDSFFPEIGWHQPYLVQKTGLSPVKMPMSRSCSIWLSLGTQPLFSSNALSVSAFLLSDDSLGLQSLGETPLLDSNS
jgi:hypothetical protein